MKYFAVNEEVENEIKRVKNEIMLSMNGICAEKINDSGLKYDKNFGVSIARLKEIAQNHEKSYELAQRLWYMSIRETKILATLLCPANKFTAGDMNEWIESTDSIETIEMLSFGILSKATHIYNEAIELLTSDSALKRLAAYHTIARITGNLNSTTITEIINNINPADLDNISAYRAIENFLLSVKMKSGEHDGEIKDFIHRLTSKPRKYSKILTESLSF